MKDEITIKNKIDEIAKQMEDMEGSFLLALQHEKLALEWVLEE